MSSCIMDGSRGRGGGGGGIQSIGHRSWQGVDQKYREKGREKERVFNSRGKENHDDADVFGCLGLSVDCDCSSLSFVSSNKARR